MNKNDFQKFHITIKSLIIKNNQLLVLTDPDIPGEICCPGGRVDVGERIEDVLYRELREEIGINLETLDHTKELYTYNQRTIEDYDWDTETEILELYFKVEIKSELPEIVLSEEHDSFIWIDKNNDLEVFGYRNEKQKGIIKKVLQK